MSNLLSQFIKLGNYTLNKRNIGAIYSKTYTSAIYPKIDSSIKIEYLDFSGYMTFTIACKNTQECEKKLQYINEKLNVTNLNISEDNIIISK